MGKLAWRQKVTVCCWIIALSIVLPCTQAWAQGTIDNCSNYLAAGDYQRAIAAGRKAVQTDPKNGIAHFCLGKSYYHIGEFNRALKSTKEAESLAVSKPDLAVVYNLLGQIYSRKADLDSAMLYFNRHLSLSRDTGDKNGEAIALNNIAGIFQDKHQYDTALGYYQQSLELQNDLHEKAISYNNIALTYRYKKDTKKAISYMKKAIDIFEREGDYRGTAALMVNLGAIYIEAKEYDSALSSLNEGLKRAKKVGDQYWESVAYAHLGDLHMMTGKPTQAEDYYAKSKKLARAIGAKDILQTIPRL